MAGIVLRVLVTFLISHFSFLIPVKAQTFLDRLQEPVEGQGRVTVHQDTTINNLVLDPQSTLKPEERRQNNHANGNSHSTPARTPQGTAPRDTTVTPSTPGTPGTTTTPQNPRNRRTVNGFRIQAYAGGNSREDRKRAERTAASIRAQFPNVAVSAHFYPPRWICYVGNYRTREDAEQMLRALKNMGYSQALIVKAKVTVH